MRTLRRIRNIIRSQKPTTLTEFGGDLMAELQKHLATLDGGITTIELNRAIAEIDKQGWVQITQQIDSKARATEDDPRKLQSLHRLSEIAEMNLNESVKKLESFDGKDVELREIRKRVTQAISLIEVENNIRSVTAMYDGMKGLAVQTQSLELETREIRRLLHTTDGLMELTS